MSSITIHCDQLLEFTKFLEGLLYRRSNKDYINIFEYNDCIEIELVPYFEYAKRYRFQKPYEPNRSIPE